ncbi:MAG: ribosome small subunit-dependent GTPase A [Bacteroidetes bacterium]|nr:ribosome small subunit-dependent GTPase A [Bacteroidota bacterium]MDF1868031.1 ribosome small subunit-dependent GTPase A [Saprospiraceae bacterium]
MQKGIVTKSTGTWYDVKCENGDIIQCRIIGKFRLDGMKLTNPVAVGDEVEFEIEDEGVGTIKKILSRKNYVVRQSPRKKHNLHLLAANIEQSVMIMTIKEPNLKQGFIDRFLLMTEPYNIPVIIVFNKSDLYDEDDLAMYEYLKAVYEAINYKVLLVSAIEEEGIEILRAELKDKVSLIGGQSGVGKSSLVNAVQSNINLRTGELSDFTGKGMHTTTFAEMFELEFGGSIIDTPGIKTLSFSNLEPLDVAHNFREMFFLSENCRFGGSCLHRNEPNCAVKEALEKEEISQLRYSNYLTILEEVEGLNHWERHKM